MSALKVIARGFCNDCFQPHGRPSPNVALCFPCRNQRIYRYRRTTWRRAQQKWNRSPKAKVYKEMWRAAHPVTEEQKKRKRRLDHIRYMARRKPTRCALSPCKNTFFRPRGSHRWMCDECAVANYYPSYLKWRSRVRGSNGWQRRNAMKNAA